MICFLNASDYPGGANDNTSSLYGVTDTSSSSSDSPDSPISIVSSSSSSNLSTISPRPSTPSASRQTFDGWKRFLVSDESCSGKNVLHHFESPSGQVFLSAEEAEKYLHSFNGFTVELNFEGLETHFLADNAENDCSNTSVPYTFCDMPPNIVDMKRRKARKPSREFNKRRRKSTTTNVSSIKSRRSTNSSSTSIDDFDDVCVTSPLTLELQELLSEVIKSVADRLDRVDEDDENENVEINLPNVDKNSQNVNQSSQNVDKSSQNVEVSAQTADKTCQNIAKSSHNVDSKFENIQVVENFKDVDVKRQSVEDRVPNVENAAQNIETDFSKPESTQTANHFLPETPFASSEIPISHSEVDTQNYSIVENNVCSTKNLMKFDISQYSPEQKTELSGNLQQPTGSEASKLPGSDPIISLDCQAMFLNTRISKRRATIDSCLMQQDNPERTRRSSAEASIAVAPILNQAPSVEEPPVDAQTSTPAGDEKIVSEIFAPKMSVEKFYSTALTKKRPGSLDLSPKLASKRKRLSGSLTPDPDHAGSKVLDLIRSSTDRPISADVLESPQELFPPPTPPRNSQERTNEQKEVVSLSCDDFEDEIAACNDFEEVELHIVQVFSNNGDLDQIDERDPLALSDKDISSPLPTLAADISTKDCRIDMVDMFYQTPLESHFCCGCSRPYSQADLFTFNLKAHTMSRICRFCFWWTSRHVGTKTKKL